MMSNANFIIFDIINGLKSSWMEMISNKLKKRIYAKIQLLSIFLHIIQEIYFYYKAVLYKPLQNIIVKVLK